MSYSAGKTRRPQNWWHVQHTRQTTVWGSEYIKNSDRAVRKWPTSKRKMGKWAKTWVRATKNNKHKWPEIHELRSISSVIKDMQVKPSRATVLHRPLWQKPRNLMISSASEDTLVKIQQNTSTLLVGGYISTTTWKIFVHILVKFNLCNSWDSVISLLSRFPAESSVYVYQKNVEECSQQVLQWGRGGGVLTTQRSNRGLLQNELEHAS